MESAPLVTLVLKHPINPWLRSVFRVRAESVEDITVMAQALRQRIERHELN